MDILLTAPEVCELLGISRATFERRLREGVIPPPVPPASSIMRRPRRLFRSSGIERLLTPR